VPTRISRPLVITAFSAMFLVAWPSAGHAQYHGHYRGRVVVAAPYYPYYPFAFGMGWGYGPWYPYPYYPYPYYAVDPGGSLKLEVTPRQAEVYVDGYYAGIVDDFDGTFQRLHTTPGEHEISLFLDGYRAVHQKLYLQPNVTTKVKYAMEKLGAGEQPEPKPEPVNLPSQSNAPDPYQPPPPRGPYPPRGQQPPVPQGPPPPQRDVRADVNAYGTLSVRVQPGGADVVVDNEKWNGPEGQERLFIELPEGRHTVEIRKSGFRSYITDVDIRRGETASLNVSLRSQEEE
jgi:PEGA domain